LAADPKQLDALALFATRWLAYPKRTTSGIVLAGAVQEVERQGKLYYAKVQVGRASDSPLVTVVSTKDPRLDLDDEALTMGSIVERPSEQLPGYEGSDSTVVWSGLTVRLSSEGK
jgi:hypothetical protein